MDAVTTASVRPDLSSRRVLTTEWIDGERSGDRSDDERSDDEWGDDNR